jgi:hypothetical protein
VSLTILLLLYPVLPSRISAGLVLCLVTTYLSKLLTDYLGYLRGELSYLAPLGSEKISAPYFKQCFFRGEGGGEEYYPAEAESNTTPPSPKFTLIFKTKENEMQMPI